MVFNRREPREAGHSRNRGRRRSSRAFNIFVIITLIISAVLLLSVLLLEDVRAPGGSDSDDGDAGATIAVFDVGQGLSTGVITSDGASMLYDFGNGASDVEDGILPFFDERDVEGLDFAILSHPHQDHVGGLPSILETVSIRTFLDPVIESTNQTYLESLEIAERLDVNAQAARQGDDHRLGDDITLEILWPPEALLTDGGGTPRINDNSTVVQMSVSDTSLLLTGDIEEEAEHRLIERYDDLDVDVLLVAHHGSSTSTSQRFLDHTTPEIAVLSAGRDNQYGHPHEEVIRRLRSNNVQFYRTDVDGTVIIHADGSGYEIATERTDASWTRPPFTPHWTASSRTSTAARWVSWSSMIGSN